ncbi:MAG TPA: pitrilysin family protein [Vicinamibacterales bacterium]|nr:pitrilysin family protein [Vicinamibacterales bacterium]
MATALRRGLTPVRTVLDNGAVVLVQETSTIPAVTLMATFLAGSIDDPAGTPGLAYMMGRLLDRGTERRAGEVIAQELDDRGVSLKVSTSRHTMSLSCTCLAEDFDQVIGIVLEVARRPVFPEPEIVKRRGEIITALRQDEDNPAVRATETLFELLYGASHPYGRRPKGTVASIERIERVDLIALHRARIRPGTLSLTVVGDVRPEHALARAARELDGWDGAASDEIMVPPPPSADCRRVAVTPMPGKSQTDIAYGFATIRRLDPRYYAYWLMNNILGQFGLGGRLADNIRERQGMAYYAFSGIEPTVGEGPLIIRAGVDPVNVERAVKAIDHEVSQLATEGPTSVELEESRQSLIGSVARMLETNQSIAVFLQNAEQFGLGLDYDRQLHGLLESVTMDEVRAAAAETLDPGRASVAIAG